MFGIIIAGILFVAGIILFKIRNSTSEVPAGVFKGLSVGAFLAAVLVLGLNSYHIVPPGHRGVQINWNGEMNMTPLEEGLQFVNPLSSVTDESIQNRVQTIKHTVEDINTQTLSLTVAINFRPKANKVTSLIKENTQSYSNVILPSAINECLKAEVAKYKVTEVVKNRPLIKTNFEAALKTWVEKYGLEIIEVGVTEIDFSDQYDKAIEAKQVAEQEAQKAVNVLTKTKTEAEMTVVNAKALADSQIEKARGEAETVKINALADAEALKTKGAAQEEYNKRVASSLNADLLQRMWIEKWSGTVPQFLTGGNSPTFLLPTAGQK